MALFQTWRFKLSSAPPLSIPTAELTGPDGKLLIDHFFLFSATDHSALPPTHIISPEGVYDMATKYPWLSGKATGSQYICPADLDLETTMVVQAAAGAAHNALGIEVYSRVDVMRGSDNLPYVLEANTIPGMTETSLLPKSAAAAGLPIPELCQLIAELSLKS